jgi:hypothetical protein
MLLLSWLRKLPLESSVRIRPGTARDVPAILKLVRGLAKYEIAYSHLPEARREAIVRI